MKQTSQKLIQPQLSPPPKKTTVEREFYVCFCAKNYNSYSALYLHAKKKHDQNLSMKFLKHTRHEWSGNVKNIYHQFVENISDEDEEQSELIYVPKKSPNSSPIKSLSDGNLQEKQKSYPKMPYELVRKLDNALQKYVQEHRKVKAAKTLINEFRKFIEKSYKNYYNQPQFSSYFSSKTLDYIPHLTNRFLQQQLSPSITKKLTHNQCIKQLEQLLDWLYTNAYTSYLAIRSQNYVEFMNQSKIKEEFDNKEGNRK